MTQLGDYFKYSLNSLLVSPDTRFFEETKRENKVNVESKFIGSWFGVNVQIFLAVVKIALFFNVFMLTLENDFPSWTRFSIWRSDVNSNSDFCSSI